MKTTKILVTVALALLMSASCGKFNNDIAITPDQPAEAEGIPFSATIRIDKGPDTRALADNGTTIEATWANGEQVALIYSVSGTPYKTDATVTANIDGTATISTTLQAGAEDGEDVTIIYPATAADGTTGNLKSDVLAEQNGLLTGEGSISQKYDVRTGLGKLSISGGAATINNGSLGTTVALTNQFSIFKFMLTDVAGNADKAASQFIISDDSDNVITTVTPISATNTLYVALPVMSGIYWFNAIVGGKPHIARAVVGTATTAGNFYHTTIKLATIGDVILSNGKFAEKGTSGERAVIAYVGRVENYFNHYLALALSESQVGYVQEWKNGIKYVNLYAASNAITIGETTYNSSTTGPGPNEYNCYDIVESNDGTTSATATASRTGWRLPTVTDWRYVFQGLCGGAGEFTPTNPAGVSRNMQYGNGKTLRDAINTACGNSALSDGYYWCSSEYTMYSNDGVWRYSFYYSSWDTTNKINGGYAFARAVFAY